MQTALPRTVSWCNRQLVESSDRILAPLLSSYVTP